MAIDVVKNILVKVETVTEFPVLRSQESVEMVVEVIVTSGHESVGRVVETLATTIRESVAMGATAIVVKEMRDHRTVGMEEHDQVHMALDTIATMAMEIMLGIDMEKNLRNGEMARD